MGRAADSPRKDPSQGTPTNTITLELDLLPSQIFLVNVMLYPKKKAHTIHRGLVPLSVYVPYVTHLLTARCLVSLRETDASEA